METVTQAPSGADALHEQAMTLHLRGRLEEADALYRHILQNEPGHFGALHLSGVIALQRGHTEAAIGLIGKALEINPHHAGAHTNFGTALTKANRHEEALASYAKALTVQPGNLDAMHNQALVLGKLNRLEEALACCDRALAIKPDHAAIIQTRGHTLRTLGRHHEALDCYDALLHLNPKNLDACIGRAATLLDLGMAEQALGCCDQALRLGPEHADVFYNRGNALRALDHNQEALACYDEALRLKPDYAGAANNRANALACLGRYREALDCYRHAAQLQPDNGSMQWNESLSRLITGDFKAGWLKYEFRWQDDYLKKAKRAFPRPLWLGKEPLQGKTILLHAEQGLGDTIQFCRYASLVAAEGATVLLETQARLASLLARLAGVDEVFSRGEPLPQFDYHCPLLSLPLAFRTELNTIPAHPSYLSPAPARVQAWQDRLGEKTQRRIGIAWSGSARHRNDRQRSIPLAAFSRLVSRPAQFFSLHQEVRETDKPALERHANLLHFGGDLMDFEDTAALIANLDLVISVDTSVAHLAGAMGKPVWLLLPFAPDWRWLLERSDSPWYPSVRLFRQPAIGDWDSVMATVASELDGWFRSA